MSSLALLDTNSLILLLFGQCHPDWIGKKKPVSNFTLVEFGGLASILQNHQGFLTIPNILTEASNLIGFGRRDTATVEILRAYISFVKAAEEFLVDSQGPVSEPEFARFGLTDTAILRLFDRNVHFITVDYGLYGKLDSLGARVTNLRHLNDLAGAQ